MSIYDWTPINPQATGVASTCLNCPPRAMRLNFNHNPHPGFGVLALLKDGKPVDYLGQEQGGRAAIRRWNAYASQHPDHQWVIEINGPMSGVRYRREDNLRWVAFERNAGFA